MIPKRYLGDGVFVAADDWMLTLTTEDGVSVTNAIHLEPEVFAALQQFERDLMAAVKAKDRS